MPTKILSLAILCTVLSACGNYGNELEYGDAILYYTNDIPQGDAIRLGNFLDTEGFFMDDKTAQLTTRNDTLLVRLIATDPEKEIPGSSAQALDQMSIILTESVFEGDPVVIEVCDQNFQPIHQ